MSTPVLAKSRQGVETVNSEKGLLNGASDTLSLVHDDFFECFAACGEKPLHRMIKCLSFLITEL